LSSSQSGDHPKNNLAKFGYILDMKVGKKNFSWLRTPIRKSDEFGTFFFMKNPLYRLKSYFKGQNLVKFANNRNAA
jgi:hypothetical protein